MKCWGFNEDGELGNGGIVSSTTPVIVSGINNAMTVSGGGDHSCSVSASSTLQCWGNNAFGQLGNGSIINSPTPVTVIGLSVSATVAASLSTLTVSCPNALNGGASGTCSATASYSDGSSKTVNATWKSSNVALASVSGSTVKASNVTADTPVTITATYTESAVTKTASAIVTLKGTGVPTSPAAVSNCVLSWAENNYPDLFPPNAAASKTFGNYFYRYYSGTTSFLGMLNNQRLFYVGSLSGGAYLDLGDIATWKNASGCQ